MCDVKIIRGLAIGGSLTLALLFLGGGSGGAQPAPAPASPQTTPAPTPVPKPIKTPNVPPSCTNGAGKAAKPIPKTIIIKKETVRVVKVPITTTTYIIREYPTPVPGPTKTVYTERFSPGQTRVIHDRIRAAVVRTSLWVVLLSFLVGLILLAIVYASGYRLGEVNDAKMFRKTIKRS